ncbi:MAG: hypothetical protein R6U32_01095 [Candidatus Woesearchaeota archaeon]
MGKETKENSTMRQRTHRGIDNMMGKAKSLGEKGKEGAARLKGKAVMVKDNINSYIQKNPKRSVLIAAGAGAAAGAIITAIIAKRKDH